MAAWRRGKFTEIDVERRRDILFISSNFPPVVGGSAVVYDQICSHAAEHVVALGQWRDHQTGEAWAEIDREDAGRAYDIHRIEYVRPPLKADLGLRGLQRHDLWVMLRTLLTATALIARHRVRVVCLGELVTAGWLVFPLRYLMFRRVYIYTHGEEISQQSYSLLDRLRGAFLAHATGVIAVSQFCKSQIFSRFGLDPQRVRVLPNGVDLSLFTPGERNRDCLPELARRGRVLLSVARLVERKGQAFLIRAMPLILESDPDVRCLIAGTGPQEAPLRALIAELGLEAHCILVGSVSNEALVELYRAVDIFVLPCVTLPDGDTEGYGLVFVEANACGLPVVAGAAGGTVEAVIDEETGLLVDGSSPTQIADAVLRILRSPDLARRLSADGLRRARTMGWEDVARGFLAICLGETPPRKAQAMQEGAIRPGPVVASANPAAPEA